MGVSLEIFLTNSPSKDSVSAARNAKQTPIKIFSLIIVYYLNFMSTICRIVYLKKMTKL